MALILAVDDEPDLLDILAYNLRRAGHTVLCAQDAAHGLAQLQQATPDLIISDVMMPDMDGLAFCSAVRARPATVLTPFLFLTAKSTAEDKYAGLRAGADDYIAKPFELADLMSRVEGRLAHRARLQQSEAQLQAAQHAMETGTEPAAVHQARRTHAELTASLQASAPAYEPPAGDAAAQRAQVEHFTQRFAPLAGIRATQLVGEHPSMLRLLTDVVLASQSDDPVLILGATGTGKTAVAEAIWALGPRAQRPFRTLNCSELAAGDATIALGKLFGYGVNSGLPNMPKQGQAGLLEEVDGGVLFLDEVAALPEAARTTLLLPLEGRPFSPAVGSGVPRTVNVKFICATNRDLQEEAAAGGFPRDLYERLAGELIHVPSLQARRSDIPRLIAHFLQQLLAEEGVRLQLHPAAEAQLLQYPWPGNIRELRRVLRRASRRAHLAARSHIETVDLPADLTASSPPAAPPALAVPGFAAREQAEIAALRACHFNLSDAAHLLGYSNSSRTLSHRLRGLCFKALSLSAWDTEAAARLLGGEDANQLALLRRRLTHLLDSLATRLDDDERPLQHLLAEHRPHALATLQHLRGLAARGGA